MIITLRDDEIKQAEEYAKQWTTVKYGYPRLYNMEAERLLPETINGIKYEMVAAKALGVPYTGGDEEKRSGFDVGGKYEVRGTEYPNGSLILHPDDKEAPYILVTGTGNLYYVRGWILASEGKQKKWWRDIQIRHPAYFVPQNALHDIDTLLKGGENKNG
jgi:hypothetical protein